MQSQLQRLVTWLRAGYPSGIPDRDYIPLFALLRRRLSDDEARQLAQELVDRGLIPPDRIDIAAGYLRITDELPSEDELVRVASLLHRVGLDPDPDLLSDADGPRPGADPRPPQS